jgi:hypothetical protein
MVASAFTDLGLHSDTATVNHYYRMWATGSSVQLFRDATSPATTLRGSFTDTSLTTGNPGINSFDATGTFDNWRGGDGDGLPAGIFLVGSAVNSSSPTADTIITLPAGTVLNDLIICAASVADNTDNGLDAPTEGGYTDVLGASDLYSDDVNDVNLDLFYKFHNGTDTTATFLDVGGTNASNVVVCMVFRGVATVAQGGPFTTTTTTATGISTSDADPPSIATVTGDAVVIVGATGHTGGAGATYTNPTNYTTNAAVRAHNDTFDGLVGMGYRLSGYSNPENPGVFTAATIGTAADNAWAAITMALKPIPSLTTEYVAPIHEQRAGGVMIGRRYV